MRCPFCSYGETSVIDSRDTEEMQFTRRRRECLKCKKRFTTYEKPELTDLFVIKKDGRREKFERGKLERGVIRACEKRPIPIEKIHALINGVEMNLRRRSINEVKSEAVGDIVSRKLLKLDTVAYVRFASVYKHFEDIEEFKREIRDISKKGK